MKTQNKTPTQTAKKKSKNKKEIIQAKNIVGVVLALAKSFFLAITQVAWGLISLFGFNALLTWITINKYQDMSLVSPLFLNLEMFIIQNIMGFVLIFFALSSYFEIKEVLKK